MFTTERHYLEPDESSQIPRPFVTFPTTLIFYIEGLLAPTQPRGGIPTLVRCPLIKHIHSQPPYLEAVSSIRNQRTHCAVVTKDPT